MKSDTKILIAGSVCSVLAAVASIAFDEIRNANAPSLTQLFQCSLTAADDPFHRRGATLFDVKDRATGKEHLELWLSQQTAPESRRSRLSDVAKVKYADGAGAETGIRDAVKYCKRSLLPMNI